MNPGDVTDVLAVIDALAKRGVTGPISVWGVTCVLPTAPGPPARAEPPVTEATMLEYFERQGGLG